MTDRHLRVLIVDDNAVNRRLLSAMLEGTRYDTVEAGDGEEALAVLQAQEDIDAVITDVLMPNLDGIALCQAVRANPRWASKRLIVYTNTYDAESDRARALMLGADAYIVKPAPPEVILAALVATRPLPAVVASHVDVPSPPTELRLYNRVLIARLEERNRELTASRAQLEQANAQIQLLHDRLQARMHGVDRELRHSTELLGHRNEQIEAFYHTLSHELKTPLTSAREIICLVADGVVGPVNEEQRGYLALARESCDQMRHCLDDLVDASRLETGKMSLKRTPASLVDVVQTVLRGMQPLFEEKGVGVDTRLADGLGEIPIDRRRVVQVVTNLLANALKFTPAGGRIDVACSAVDTPIPGQRVIVTDRGPGVPREHQKRIFDRLYQVRSGDATTEQGMGLGLFLCRELVELHGGRIGLQSGDGDGSAFWFVLPAAEPAQASDQPSTARGQSRG